jgi:predicted enzyme related to lactoylglutathione lyase
MDETRTYPEGVPSWIDIEQPDLDAAQAFYGGLFGWTFEPVTPPDAPLPLRDREAGRA